MVSNFNFILRRFIKLKVESSGFPKGDLTKEEVDDFIKGYYDMLGVKLDKNNMMENSGLRHIAKLVIKTAVFLSVNFRFLIHCGANFL
jgi:hypothetical protein